MEREEEPGGKDISINGKVHVFSYLIRGIKEKQCSLLDPQGGKGEVISERIPGKRGHEKSTR